MGWLISVGFPVSGFDEKEKRGTPIGERLGGDAEEQSLRVEHQSIEIKDDSADQDRCLRAR
jgi:hypothetical protein